MADETYQSLYRRYRPNRFGEVLGQDHVTHALRNAARDGRVSQGYLFSGPRGTGKTSTARILAKALNCDHPDEGEPCGVCDSCTSITAGHSFAVIEMDAASNNGVDAMRDLVSKASLGTTGLRKVYIIDEVHMLSQAASNTLLKTLEEPPAHVVFVLATTDPQKVLPTIISRVQHFQFHLLGADTLGDLVRSVNADAGLGLDDRSLDNVVRRGAGSARDALSVLDQAAALGAAEDEVAVAGEVLEALAERDPARALTAVAAGCAAGRDPRWLAEETLSALRDAFLAGRAPAIVDLPAAEVDRLGELGRRLGPAALVRAMETIGEALGEMREALDARVTLEVALVRVTAPEADVSPAAMLERIERLERGLAAPGRPSRRAEPSEGVGSPASEPRDIVDAGPGPAVAYGPANLPKVPPPPPAGSVRAAPPPPPPAPPPPTPGRRTIGSVRSGGPTPPAEPDDPVGPESAAGASVEAADVPTREELTKAWGDEILGRLPPRARSRFAAGRFLPNGAGHAVFALPGVAHRDQCAPLKVDVEAALAAHFRRPVPLRLVAEEPPSDRSSTGPDDESTFVVSDLVDAPAAAPTSPAERVKSAFPGAEEVPS